MLIDTHAHLQWPSFDSDRTEVIARAAMKNIMVIVNVGYDLAACRQAIGIAEQHEGVVAAVGIHPHNANTFTDGTLRALRNLAKESKVVAVGEIGLDFYRNLSPNDHQMEAFDRQLALAEDLSLPVVIHQRDAAQETLKVLQGFSGKRTLMHCWSGGLDTASSYVKLGCMISLAGPVTFPNARRLYEVAKNIPISSLVLETDSPWLAPQPYRGRRNEPSFLVSIADAVAELRGVDAQAISDVTTENAKRFDQATHGNKWAEKRSFHFCFVGLWNLTTSVPFFCRYISTAKTTRATTRQYAATLVRARAWVRFSFSAISLWCSSFSRVYLVFNVE